MLPYEQEITEDLNQQAHFNQSTNYFQPNNQQDHYALGAHPNRDAQVWFESLYQYQIQPTEQIAYSQPFFNPQSVASETLGTYFP